MEYDLIKTKIILYKYVHVCVCIFTNIWLIIYLNIHLDLSTYNWKRRITFTILLMHGEKYILDYWNINKVLSFECKIAELLSKSK